MQITSPLATTERLQFLLGLLLLAIGLGGIVLLLVLFA